VLGSSLLGLSEGDSPDYWWYPILGFVVDLVEDLGMEEHHVGRLETLLKRL